MVVAKETLMNPIWFITLVVFLTLIWNKRTCRRVANNIISTVIHEYLLWRYPVYFEGGNKPIPTCPYRFPNGQGDVAKFLEGVKNSKTWKYQHGSVYRIWSGMRPEIVISSPEDIRNVFSDSDKHSKAINNNSGHLMSQLLGKCVGLINGSEWKTVRSGIEESFQYHRIPSYIPMVLKHVARHFDKLNQEEQLEQGYLDPAEGLKMVPFWITAQILYGELNEDMTTELNNLILLRESLFKQVIDGNLARFSMSRFLPTETNKYLRSFQSRWESFNDKAYAQAMALGELTLPIVRLYELVHLKKITLKNMLHTLDESLFANLDVTTGGISWNIIFLAAFRQYQGLLSKELKSYKCGEDNRQQYILSNRTLLAACVSESSRLRPAAAFSVPQSAPTPRIVGGGYVIPAGTDFIVDTHSLNSSNEYWGTDSHTYRPERFLETSPTASRYNLWRFGFGPRQCIGKYVADVVIRSLIIHLVENYELSLRDTEWTADPKVWISQPRMRVKCTKKVK
ncbi:putative cytochrome P450 monooxygenase [Xylaria sp. FL1777]|nr:putative cytochrome P450 monooxygenase [Xylaria sp. FL1777]